MPSPNGQVNAGDSNSSRVPDQQVLAINLLGHAVKQGQGSHDFTAFPAAQTLRPPSAAYRRPVLGCC